MRIMLGKEDNKHLRIKATSLAEEGRCNQTTVVWKNGGGDMMSFKYSTSKARIEKIQQVLRGRPMTIFEICDAINLSKRWTYAYLDYLKEQRLIHIKEYRQRLTGKGLVYTAIFSWGDGVDATEPRTTKAEIALRKRMKRRAMNDDYKHSKPVDPTRFWTAQVA